MMSVEEIKKAIEALSPADKRKLLMEVMPGLSKEVLRDEELHHEAAQQVKLFGKAAKQVIGKKLSRWSRASEDRREDEDLAK